MTKTLLALQFWNGDRETALELARLIADIEPTKSEEADFLFVARFDSTQDDRTVQHVARKFNVFTHTVQRQGEGWPDGCNNLWFGTMDHILNGMECGKLPQYKNILTFEADCLPLQKNWINVLRSGWDKQSEKGPLCCFGAMQPGGPHINGNALFAARREFLNLIVRRISGAPCRVGWDFYLAKVFAKLGWSDFPAIRSHWGTSTLTPEGIAGLQKDGVAFFHGVKDRSGLDWARQNLV